MLSLENEVPKNKIKGYTPIEKKIRKVVEEVLIQYESEFKDKFGEQDMLYVMKHKAQIGKLAVEDNILECLIKDEVEDFIGVYLIKKNR